MDPIANLREQLEQARTIIDIYHRDDEQSGVLDPNRAYELADMASNLAELVLALNEWRIKGGFDPYLSQSGEDHDQA